MIKGFDDYVKQKKFFKNNSSKEAQFSKGKQWMWAIHKCVGIPGPMVTDLNIHKDFSIWLEKRNRAEDLVFLKALGQVGGRWGTGSGLCFTTHCKCMQCWSQ